MEDAGDDKKFVKRKVLVNPNVIEDFWEKGKEPFTYLKRWRHLRLYVKDYEFLRAYKSMETDFLSEIDEILDEGRESQGLDPSEKNEAEKEERRKLREIRHLAKRARENFEALSEDEKKEFTTAHLRLVRPSDNRRLLALDGWGEIEGRRSIEVFSVIIKDKGADPDYKKTFDRIRLTIREEKDDFAGSLMHWTESLRQHDDDDPGDDYLLADLRVKEGTLVELEQEIRQRGWKVPLEVNVEAHLFQHEMDESLAEPYHYQSYNMVYDRACSIILNSICVGRKLKAATEEVDDEGDIDDQQQNESINPDEQFRERVLSKISEVGVSLKQIRIALWVVAIIFLISLFV